jgi:hypothetical protein
MELAGDAAEKKRVLSGLAGTKSLAALNIAAEHLDDLALHLEAESAAVRIAQGVYGSYPQRSKEVLEKVIQGTKNETLRQQAQQVISQIERFDDYLTAWQVSGPYTKENVDGPGLFDVAFAPEQQGQEAQWRILPAGTSPDQPWLIELDKDQALAGDNRVAYLRTRLWSPKEQKARLELGSDDGAKVWLNGQLVHANNAVRPVKPGEDKADVTLKEGWNPMLVKLTQGEGQGFVRGLWTRRRQARRSEGEPDENEIGEMAMKSSCFARALSNHRLCLVLLCSAVSERRGDPLMETGREGKASDGAVFEFAAGSSLREEQMESTSERLRE